MDITREIYREQPESLIMAAAGNTQLTLKMLHEEGRISLVGNSASPLKAAAQQSRM